MDNNNLPRRQIFQEIRTDYNDKYKLASDYCSAMEKLSIVREQLHFNLRCKRTNILPPSLKFSPPIKTREAIDYFRNTVGKKCLVFYINDGHRRINQYVLGSINLENELSTALPNEVFQCLKQTAIEKQNVSVNVKKKGFQANMKKYLVMVNLL